MWEITNNIDNRLRFHRNCDLFFCVQGVYFPLEGGEILTIYVDSLFLLNGILNHLLLLATARLTGAPIRLGRVVGGAILGGLYAVGAVLPGLGWLSVTPVKALMMVMMILVAFGWRLEAIKEALVFFALSCAFGGVVLLVVNVFGTGLMVVGGSAYYPVSGWALLLTAAAVYLVAKVALRGLASQLPAELVTVRLEHQGEVATITALYDTGNALKDPITNRGVVVLDWQAAPFLLPPHADQGQIAQPADHFARWQKAGNHWRLIPSGAVGVGCGLLLARPCETMKIGKETIQNGLVAFSPTAVSSGGGYQALIGGRL